MWSADNSTIRHDSPRSVLQRYAIFTAIFAISLVSGGQTSDSFASKKAVAKPAAPLYHAVAMHGSPKYQEGFEHFDYVNDKAPKGGSIKQATIGTFDSFNPFISKGVAASGLDYLYASLTYSSKDEPFTQYAYVANKIELPDDRSWVTYHINPLAKFHDGHPIEASDVKFSFDIRRKKGDPSFQHIFAGVKEVKVLDKHRVKFIFKDTMNRELALIVGNIEILPQHYWAKRKFDSTLKAPLGSGPYKIKDFKAGKQVRYQRIKNHWAESLPIFKGRYNFDEIIFDYYLDSSVALEAFKAGQFDFRMEHNSKHWATLYTGAKFNDGTIIREEIPHQQSAGMQGFIFNLRNPLFQDRVLRKALNYALDFEWSNKNLFYGQYKRTVSYFQNSDLSATGFPTDEEIELLTPYEDSLPKEVFSQEFRAPTTDGSGRARNNLRTAILLLKRAGYTVEANKLYTPEGEPVSFEFLIHDSGFERIVLPFIKNLQTLGVEATLRKVDVTQFIERRRNYDFDMIVLRWNLTLSPGNEQRSYWHSTSADVPDSQNFIGIKDPVIDKLVDLVIAAPDRKTLVNRSRALDRVLQWGYYVIPNWHVNYDRIAYQNKLARPDDTPIYGFDIDSFWIK